MKQITVSWDEEMTDTFPFVFYEVAESEVQRFKPDITDGMMSLAEDDFHLVIVLNWPVDVRYVTGLILEWQ